MSAEEYTPAMIAQMIAQMIEAQQTNARALAALRNALVVERDLAAEVDRLRVALDAANAALANATDDLGAAQDEIDALRADLKRYTDVYGDPDAPIDVAHLFTPEAPGVPLTPGLAAMADRVLRGTPISPIAIADTPRIKVGDHVRCEALGNLTGTVARVTATQLGGAGCIVRDDEMGHEWFAMADLLEVLP